MNNLKSGIGPKRQNIKGVSMVKIKPTFSMDREVYNHLKALSDVWTGGNTSKCLESLLRHYFSNRKSLCLIDGKIVAFKKLTLIKEFNKGSVSYEQF